MDMLSDDGFPLYKRGWVFQELSLSPRVIHYGREELIWHCLTDSKCESDSWRICSLSRLVQLDLRAGSVPVRLSWYEVMRAYSCRKPIFGKDKLPAIAAFAARVQAQDCKKRYIHGFWEDTLRYDLL